MTVFELACPMVAWLGDGSVVAWPCGRIKVLAFQTCYMVLFHGTT